MAARRFVRHRWHIALIGVLLVAVILRTPGLGGPGYALDEEITFFAVRGIEQSGLPLFPSGVVSDRGLPFSYAAWAAGVIAGHQLPAYRFVSLLSGLATILVLYVVTRSLVSSVAAIAAALLLALFPLHIAVSGWARFYAAAIAAFLGSIALFLASERRRQYLGGFVASVTVSALLHELCVVLIALPLLAAVIVADDDRDRARRWMQTFFWSAAAVVAARSVVVALHFVGPNRTLNPWLYQGASVAAPSRLLGPFAPISHSTAVTFTVLTAIVATACVALVRWRKAPPVYLAVCTLAGLFFQLGALAAATLVATLLRPARSVEYLRIAGVTALLSATYWTLHTWLTTSAALTPELFRSLTLLSASYPLGAVRFFVQSLPLTSLLLAAVVVLTCRRPSTRRERHVRTLTALLALSLVVLGAMSVDVASRYFLVSWPLILIAAAYAVDRLLHVDWPVRIRPLRSAAAVALIVLLGLEHRAFSSRNPVLTTGGNPPLGRVERVAAQEWAFRLAAVPRDAIVISNDELAASYHVGRVDYWLPTSDWDLARYELVTESGRYGEYAGARVISTADGLWKAAHRSDGRSTALVLFRTGRFEYDLARQLALDVLGREDRVVVDEASGLFVLTLPKNE